MGAYHKMRSDDEVEPPEPTATQVSDLSLRERLGTCTVRENEALAILDDIESIARDNALADADEDAAAVKPLLMNALFPDATEVFDNPGFLLCCYLPGAPTAETIKSVLAHLEMEVRPTGTRAEGRVYDAIVSSATYDQDVAALTKFTKLSDKESKDRKRDAQYHRNQQRDVNRIARHIVKVMAAQAKKKKPTSIQEVLRANVFADTGRVRRDTSAKSPTRGQAALWAAQLKVLQGVVRHFQVKYPLWAAWNDANGEAPSPPAQPAEPTIVTRKRKKTAVVPTQTVTAPADVIDLTSSSDDDAVLSPPAYRRKMHWSRKAIRRIGED
ncbi:hypothetical protein SDRG_10509 [Saprolegnia diclina VS20]|uniref:Uncharacterized protein n=1 Tax=Saprolegnia diclina (strain VS20) TaxID=1156394 RepID=T0QAK9_SAPDV|nr:hypothetical protein SDRG_10509 [Saprolegnia diclina VS20]EQC31716.1 hypothetical protein SDRG_10509 [Saprolegnia diclina VS20]|eukprot:XP_008614723.1 hypothetical protein SDRG_10509 [Saprolegnia diclina VS20]